LRRTSIIIRNGVNNESILEFTFVISDSLVFAAAMAAAAAADANNEDSKKDEEEKDSSTDDVEFRVPIKTRRETIFSLTMIIYITNASKTIHAATMTVTITRALILAMILANLNAYINHIIKVRTSELNKHCVWKTNEIDESLVKRCVIGSRSSTGESIWAQPDSTVLQCKHVTTNKTDLNQRNKFGSGFNIDNC